MAVGRFETIAVFLPVVLIVGGVIWYENNSRLEYQAKNAPARAAGFTDAAEMVAASAAGIADPIAYRARVEAGKAKQAADDVIRERNRRAAEDAGAAPPERTQPRSWRKAHDGFIFMENWRFRRRRLSNCHNRQRERFSGEGH